ncbi:NCS2 family permease [Intestinibaculum porci]|uniref:Guanine permease n=1 Tax=Intestinibaculum porci TaxID=2487118 RepID=A0A3G9JLH0_9FIRM|nr:NCS2 family permease [Intestinibaculum porci]MDD6349194.1 NCS2 family permease [Intestinibaculum porci]BBH25853.1 guanine permease [Intestinibaculum porci]HAN58145.1 NCS2 family permease [Erysipelotrichaceae bacterium]
MENFFKLEENGTNVKTEILAGITTFLAMAYILAVNPSILHDAGMPKSGVFFATAISSGVISILMGVLANYPVALSSGMGVNALFTYTIVAKMGLSWRGALACVLVSGIIFVLITVTNIRKMIINAIPSQLKLAIGAGIGFFVAFVGLKNAGIIVTSPATLVSLGSFTKPSVLLALIGIIVTLVLVVRNVPAGVFVGLVITAIIGVIMNALGFADMPQFTGVASANFDVSLVGQALNGFGELFSHPQCWLAIFSLLFVDFFDTAGTLVAVAGKTKLMDENGELKNVERALLADSIGTCFGALMGTSTVTSFVESASGVGVGGRTGLTACVTGVLFLLASFLSPLLSIVTYSVTAPALVVVGIMMAQQLKGIDWDNMIVASATFITVLVMILGYSISNGIAAGFIVYAAGMIAGGKAKEVNWIVWVLSLLFIFYFAVAPK